MDLLAVDLGSACCSAVASVEAAEDESGGGGGFVGDEAAVVLEGVGLAERKFGAECGRGREKRERECV